MIRWDLHEQIDGRPEQELDDERTECKGEGPADRASFIGVSITEVSSQRPLNFPLTS
jgi:hypothetical protein